MQSRERGERLLERPPSEIALGAARGKPLDKRVGVDGRLQAATLGQAVEGPAADAVDHPTIYPKRDAPAREPAAPRPNRRTAHTANASTAIPQTMSAAMCAWRHQGIAIAPGTV